MSFWDIAGRQDDALEGGMYHTLSTRIGVVGRMLAGALTLILCA
jgi:hypothetical protein